LATRRPKNQHTPFKYTIFRPEIRSKRPVFADIIALVPFSTRTGDYAQNPDCE